MADALSFHEHHVAFDETVGGDCVGLKTSEGDEEGADADEGRDGCCE